MKIKETRRLYAEDLRALCIEHDWFNAGDCEEYDKLFDMVRNKHMTAARLLKVAQYIQQHTTEDRYEILGLDTMVYCLCEKCRSCFSVEE